MLEVWFLTVFSEILNDLAICLSLIPRARALITSNSLSASGGAARCVLPPGLPP
jgi:hypothetical protein